ncbi:unnamed protein product [Fraxinus pennsylvanica]|uniref:UspA domain-containing protein n=1 Tax=Fraxinus pennsylvanica TaxID=56036 RepID=A0AAD1ZP99_9LAMI|nr:unnamed protein product [Fraxinus pennsylvanica]
MQHPSPDSDMPPLASIKVRSSSPRFPPPTTPLSTETPTANAQRKIGIAVDLSDESAFAVKWAVHNYLRPGDAVVLVHVRPTSVLYGADWGSVDLSIVDTENEESQRKLEDDFDTFTTTKSTDLAQPLVEAQIPFKIHIVKDHDMRERLCLEVERLGLNILTRRIMLAVESQWCLWLLWPRRMRSKSITTLPMIAKIPNLNKGGSEVVLIIGCGIEM